MNFIKRKLLNKLREHLFEKEITFITGPRQSGKTTLMKVLEKELKSKNYRTLYINLDFEEDFSYLSSQKTFLKKLELEFGKEKGFVFIDEIQRKENAGVFLKGLYDVNFPYKFVVSGSGSVELKEKIKESLVGRKRIFELRTINFEEFVNFKTEYKYESRLKLFFEVEKESTLLLLKEYLNFGGYPRIVTESREKEKRELIKEIFNSYIEKDIAYLLKVAKPYHFSLLVRYLAILNGKLINLSKLSTEIGISQKTLREYLWYLEKTYIIKLVNPFYTNKSKELSKTPVCYFYDIGLKNYASGEYGNVMNWGFNFQNFVFLELLELSEELDFSIHFWRSKDKAEVDFVLRNGQKIIPIEVKWKNFKKIQISRSMRSFIKQYKPKVALIVNPYSENKVNIDSTVVKIIPFYKLKENII